MEVQGGLYFATSLYPGTEPLKPWGGGWLGCIAGLGIVKRKLLLRIEALALQCVDFHDNKYETFKCE